MNVKYFHLFLLQIIDKFYFIRRLIDVTTRHRAETEMETERLRTAQIQAERMLETRERANRTKIKGLEETVSDVFDSVNFKYRKIK